ncbi:hypothetical protein Ndes2526B_g03677 [Nannochloris sp. 'desiccata']|nr:putative tRNA-dihydrouridine(47) synthase [NAD(P)(+)]-like [Chlorella desiccata (nom. nud.)]
MSVPIESIEARLERQELPVKYEYCRLQNARVAYVEHLRRTSAKDNVTDGTIDGDGATGNAVKPSDMSQKKSRNALKRERAQARKQAGPKICVAYAQGSCPRDSACKYSHDILAYMQSKGPDYPGKCPFAAAEGGCPYGVMCRWAGSHKNIHPLVKEYLEKKQKEDVEKNAEKMEEDMEKVRKEEEKIEEEEEEQQPRAEPPVVTPAAIAAAAAAIRTAASEQPEDSKDAFYKMDGTIPSQPLILEPTSIFAPTMNILDNQIQNKIRKGEYDFSTTDAVLAKLGINNPAKNRYDKAGKQGSEAEVEKMENPIHGADADADGDGNGNGTAEPESNKRPRLDLEAEKAVSAIHSDADFLNSLEKKTEPATVAAARTITTTAAAPSVEPTAEPASFYTETPFHRRERKKSIDFRGKTFLAPLTTVGNLPFRRLCKSLGADITCGEMALGTNLLQGQASEWALLKRHPEEDCFGVQLCGGFGDAMARCAQMVEENLQVDFVDVNFGCPIDVVINKGAGSACLLRPNRIKNIIQSMTSILSCPLTLKMRKGYTDKQDIAHLLLPKVARWGAAAVTLHGRTREQRYSRLADWEYIKTCADVVKNLGGTNVKTDVNGNGVAEEKVCGGYDTINQEMQLIGNGDVMSFEDHERAITEAGVATTYVARGALMKPWVFTEIKERRHWDISASERLDLVKKFALNGIEHWGSDTRGIENTRRFLLEWLSFANRYVPVGLIEVLPQKTNQRPPAFVGRNDLETLLSSPDPRDWIYITEMVLGPALDGFRFTPKHKGTSYASAGGGGDPGGGGGGRGGGKMKNHGNKEQEF